VRLPSLLPLVLLALTPLSAQWTNRYPLAKGYRHHIYLEGYELPLVGSGVLDPAPSPDGKSVYFSGSGWIWKQDLATGRPCGSRRGAPATPGRPFPRTAFAWPSCGTIPAPCGSCSRTW